MPKKSLSKINKKNDNNNKSLSSSKGRKKKESDIPENEAKNKRNAKIPERELNIICEDISLHYFQIVEKWKLIHSGNIKFYC